MAEAFLPDPDQLITFQWNPNGTLKEYWAQHQMWINSMLFEILTFFQCGAFEIKCGSGLTFWRQLSLSFLAIPAVAEYYAAVTQGVSRLGHNCWLLTFVILSEVVVTTKYYLDSGLLERSRRIPDDILYAWGSFFVLHGAYAGLHFYLQQTTTRTGIYPKWLVALRYISFLPLLNLFRYYKF